MLGVARDDGGGSDHPVWGFVIGEHDDGRPVEPDRDDGPSEAEVGACDQRCPRQVGPVVPQFGRGGWACPAFVHYLHIPDHVGPRETDTGKISIGM